MKKILLIITLILISCNSYKSNDNQIEYKLSLSFNSLKKLNNNLKNGLSQSKKVLINDSIKARIYPLSSNKFKLIFKEKINNHNDYILVPSKKSFKNYFSTENPNNSQIFSIVTIKFIGSKIPRTYLMFPLLDQEGIELNENRFIEILNFVKNDKININDSSLVYDILNDDQFDLIYLLNPFNLKYNPIITLKSKFNSVDKSILSIQKKIKIDSFEDANLDEKVYLIEDKKINLNDRIIKLTKKSMYVFKNCVVNFSKIQFDGNSSSILFLNSKVIVDKSSFKNFANPIEDKHGYILPSAITFYDSKIDVKNSVFKENLYGDDLVNTYKSKFNFTDTNFLNSKADALDSDFSEGVLKNCEFVNSGNDAIDTSGSTVEIINVNVINSSDKGISSGENSNINITNSLFKNNAIALVLKMGLSCQFLNQNFSQMI